MAKKTTSSSRAVSPPAGRPLVIVESPAKAKTIRGFLGSDYQVEASVGHIRDLPASNKEIPAVPKGLKARFGTMTGIDVDRDFEPYYVISSGKKLQVEKLQKLLAEASVLYLATDEDNWRTKSRAVMAALAVCEASRNKVPGHVCLPAYVVLLSGSALASS